jgi:soluble lytic murein transglycosylase
LKEKDKNDSILKYHQPVEWLRVSGFVEAVRRENAAVSVPSPAAAQTIERARQLYAADLPEMALNELRLARRRLPGENSLSYFAAQISVARRDYDSAIRILRGAFPDYDSRSTDELPDEVWKLLYPFEHWDISASQARVNRIDPALVMGLIRQESAFNQKARSPADARGLMQLLPSTGRALAKSSRIQYSSARLFQAEINIKLGTRHLAGLIRKYDGREELALAAFNAGDSRVQLWTSRADHLDMAEFVERIPFSETRGYVKQVLTNAAYYNQLREQLFTARSKQRIADYGMGQRKTVTKSRNGPIQPSTAKASRISQVRDED